MKTALLHYWLTNMRGGVKVLAALGEMLPEADIFTHAFGMGMREKGEGTREKVRGRRDEGEGTRDEGRGTRVVLEGALCKGKLYRSSAARQKTSSGVSSAYAGGDALA